LQCKGTRARGSKVVYASDVLTAASPLRRGPRCHDWGDEKPEGPEATRDGRTQRVLDSDVDVVDRLQCQERRARHWWLHEGKHQAQAACAVENGLRAGNEVVEVGGELGLLGSGGAQQLDDVLRSL
jgi:hypothetical protein